MTPRKQEDGVRQEPTLSTAEKAEGFAAVMKRLKSHGPDERAGLLAQAEEVVLGHEAYALGQEYVDRGDYEAARRWFRVAADHHAPGAAQALEEIALRQTLDGFSDLVAVGGDQAAADAVSCETILSPSVMFVVDGNRWFKDNQAWAPVMEGLYAGVAAAARQQAGRITAQARREADAILAEARQQAEVTAAACAQVVLETEQERAETAELVAQARQRAEGLQAACAESVLKTEQDRREAAELLAEARQLVESVRSEVAEIDEKVRRRAREMLAKAEREALLIVDAAREGAAQIRGRARRQVGGPDRAHIQSGWDFVRHLEEAFTFAECIRTPVGYPVDGMYRGAIDRSARWLPVPTRPGQSALARLSQVPLSGTVVLLVEGENDSGLWRWMRVAQEREGQDGVGPASWSGTWHVLDVDTSACDESSAAFERDVMVVRQDGGPVVAIGVMKTGGGSDDDAELDVEEVPRPSGR